MLLSEHCQTPSFGVCPLGHVWNIPLQVWRARQPVPALSCSLFLPPECKACYHKSCFKSTRCPRCERLQARRELLAKQSMESYISDYEDDELEQQEAATAT